MPSARSSIRIVIGAYEPASGTSGNHGVGHLEEKPPDTPKHLKYEKEMTAAQARFLTQSSNSKQIFARQSSEYIQFDEPDTVISAIREVYEQTKRP